MKKITFLLIALVAGVCALQLNAQPAEKAPNRTAGRFAELPDGYTQLGETQLYYSIIERTHAEAGRKTGISLIGEIDGWYYSSTYSGDDGKDGGAGFIAAFKVDNNSAVYVDASTVTTDHKVNFTTDIEPAGDAAARIIYRLTNTDESTVTVSAGVYGDIMIGDNDNAPLSCLKDEGGEVYGIKMKYRDTDDSPLLCALFGDGVTGVTPKDDYWFGFYRCNADAYKIVGDYSNRYGTLIDIWTDSHYMKENSTDYDCGLGFCWKDRSIAPGETLELSYIISVGEIEFEEPIVPGEDVFTYTVEPTDLSNWNDLSEDAEHPFHIFGYYEHPYGQHGFIEYRADNGEWIRINQELVSGEEYDLPFNVIFDGNITDIHTLELRFTDGLDNNTDLTPMSWIDVRSADIEVPTDLVYNGGPQTVFVTVQGEQVNVGEFTFPGEYDFTALVGNYNEGTIGENVVNFTIDKAPCVIDVQIPEDTEWDGEAHGATVTVPEGSGEVTVTYVKVGTDIVLTEAPVDCGIYIVVVEVAEGDYYYGMPETLYGPFEIYASQTAVKEVNVETQDNGAWYTIDGRRVAAPTQPGLYIHNGKKYIVK